MRPDQAETLVDLIILEIRKRLLWSPAERDRIVRERILALLLREHE